MTTSRNAEVALLGAKTGNSGMNKTMTEYRKRLEAIANLIERPPLDDVELAQSVAIQHAQDLRSLLSDVGRMREALRVLVNAVHTVNDHQGRIVVDRHATEQARQALSVSRGDGASRDHDQSTTAGAEDAPHQTRS